MSRSRGLYSAIAFIKPKLVDALTAVSSFLNYSNRYAVDCSYGVDNYELCKLYIDLRFIGIDRKIPLYVPKHDKGLSRDLAQYGCREPIHVRILWKLIEELHPVVLDVGSNVGYFPLIELEAGAKHVVAVEPVPISFKALEYNLRNYASRTTLIQAAVVDDDRQLVRMTVSDRLNIAAISDRGNLIVRAININELLRKFRPNVMRMDIEGYEWRVLSAIDREFDLMLIDIETHFIPDLRLVVKAFKNLYELGFKRFVLIKGLRVVPRIVQHCFNSITRLEEFLTKVVPRLRKQGLAYTSSLKNLVTGSLNLIDIFGKHMLILKGEL